MKEVGDLNKMLTAGNEQLLNRKTNNVDMRVIENWLNETLTEARYYEIKATFRKIRTNQIPLQDYGIDRMTLSNSGIS